MTGTPFALSVDALGRGSIVLDGHTLEGHTGVSVVAVPGEPTRVTIEVPADAVVVGEGIVEVVRPAGPSGDLVRALDPREVEQEVLAQAGFGRSTAAIWLETIAARLDAEGDG